jgi:hypothetical protein
MKISHKIRLKYRKIHNKCLQMCAVINIYYAAELCLQPVEAKFSLDFHKLYCNILSNLSFCLSAQSLEPVLSCSGVESDFGDIWIFACGA